MSPAQPRSSSSLFLVMLVLVVLAVIAFVFLRANGSHPGTAPASHPLQQGTPASK